ncbi:MAG: hypothetical protein RLZZ24_1983, partial [Pseudomonadota bacterium]
AIDAFIEAVQHDPDTSELHFALGNLFRRRGEYERAVRVHQHLLSRDDLTDAERERAQHALALDYLKAGLLDRAEAALQLLEGTSYQTQAHLALLSIYERSRDWVHAFEVARKLNDSGQGSFATRMAHYLCEQALALSAEQATQNAESLLQEAMQVAPQSARPRMALAHLYKQTQRPQAAYDCLIDLLHVNPSALPLLAAPLSQLAIELQQIDAALNELEAAYSQFASLDVLQAIITLHAARGEQDNRQWYARHLQREASLVAATQWLAQSSPSTDEVQPLVQRALEKAAKPLQRYRCAACGFEANQHFWQCPGCQAWDSYPPRRVEEL